MPSGKPSVISAVNKMAYVQNATNNLISRMQYSATRSSEMVSKIQSNIVNVLLSLLLFSSISLGQGGSVVRQVIAPNTAQNGTGQPASYANIRVCDAAATGTPCSPLVTSIYADQALTIPLPSAFAADVNGNYEFFIGTGTYLIQESNAIGAGYTFNYAWIVYANGSGSVSSVDLSMPSIFTVSGNPVTTAGTLTVDLNTQSADTVFGNCTGSTAVPSFCSLIANQIPSTLNATTINGLTVTGAETVSTTLGVTGATTLSSTLGVTGATVLSSTLNVTGLSTLAAVNATTVNASTGFRISSAAPSNHILVGNGTNYVDSATLPSSALPTATLYYQTVDLSGAAQTQRLALNFNSALFTAADSASPSRTNIGLNTTGTGTYVATYAASPGASTALATFDGNGNLAPSSVVAVTGDPGRITLPGGVIMQWFTGTTDAAPETTYSHSFPLTFPTSVWNIQVTYQEGTSSSSDDCWYQIVSFSTSAVVLRKQGTGGTCQTSIPHIFAIGN